MKFSSTLWATISIILLFQLNACIPEQTANEEQLLGRWEIVEASRNGKVTESLAELFFEFYPEGKMRTNINGTAEEASYKWTSNKLLQHSGQRDINYDIESIEDSSLILSAQIQGHSFKFILEKILQEE